MTKPIAYTVFYAERFHAVLEGIFSTREKAQGFLDKLVALEEASGESRSGEYEIREEIIDELDDAFAQHAAIATYAENSGVIITPLYEGELVAQLEPVRYLRYRDGSGAIIAYGITPEAAFRAAEGAVEAAASDYFTNPTAYLSDEL